MRYWLVSMGVILICAALSLAGFESSKQIQEPVNAESQKSPQMKLSASSNMGFMDCQAIHEQIRAKKDDSELRKGFWNVGEEKQYCPILSEVEYQALQ